MLALTPITCVGDEPHWCDKVKKRKEKESAPKNKNKKTKGEQLITWHTMATKITEGHGKQRALGDGNSGEKNEKKLKKYWP